MPNVLPNALSVQNLTKTYHRKGHDTHALEGVSFKVQQGELFGLLGPNGAGKSTLIGILGGLVTPDAGTIEALGMNVICHHRCAARQNGGRDRPAGNHL